MGDPRAKQPALGGGGLWERTEAEFLGDSSRPLHTRWRRALPVRVWSRRRGPCPSSPLSENFALAQGTREQARCHLKSYVGKNETPPRVPRPQPTGDGWHWLGVGPSELSCTHWLGRIYIETREGRPGRHPAPGALPFVAVAGDFRDGPRRRSGGSVRDATLSVGFSYGFQPPRAFREISDQDFSSQICCVLVTATWAARVPSPPARALGVAFVPLRPPYFTHCPLLLCAHAHVVLQDRGRPDGPGSDSLGARTLHAGALGRTGPTPSVTALPAGASGTFPWTCVCAHRRV